MGESPLWFRKLLAWKDTVGEGQPIVQKGQCTEKEKPCYGSINGRETADVSCVPCGSIASRGSVTCPTCQGTGRIPREQEQQLVALIPYGDQRLKPRRTKLYVTATVAGCLLMTCLMMYFLFPRSIAVLPAGLNASSVSFDNFSDTIILNMTNTLNVTNSNFYTVRVAQLAVEVLHKALVIGKNTTMTHLDIPPLQGAQQYLHVVQNKGPQCPSAHTGYPDMLLPLSLGAAGLRELPVCGLQGQRHAPREVPIPALSEAVLNSWRSRPCRSPLLSAGAPSLGHLLHPCHEGWSLSWGRGAHSHLGLRAASSAAKKAGRLWRERSADIGGQFVSENQQTWT